MRTSRFPVLAAFLLIVVLALFLRTYHLGTNPPGFFRDEADKGYTAYSLLHTGRDVSGAFLPLFVKSFAVYTTALYQYLDVPIIAILGLNEFATRFPAALAGTATTALVFLFMRCLFDWKTGILSALLLTFSPWHLLFSRWANQGILLPLFLVLAFYLLIRVRDMQASRSYYIVTALCGIAFGLALYSYEPAKALVPLLLVISFLCLLPNCLKGSHRRMVMIIIIIVLVMALPMLVFHLQQSSFSQARFNRISIFQDSPSLLTAAARFLTNLSLHLSPQFLFFSGDTNPRHNFGGSGVYHRLDALFLLLALIETIRTRKSALIFLWLWLIAGFIPASLTNEGLPHALRSIGGLLAGVCLAGRGAASAWEMLAGSKSLSLPTKRLLGLAVTGFYGVVLIGFLWGAFRVYPIAPIPNASWSAGWRQGIRAYASMEQNQGWPALRTVYIDPSAFTEFPHIFFQFYLPVNPSILNKRQAYPRFQYPDGEWHFRPSLMHPGDAVLYDPEYSALPLQPNLRWGIVTMRSLPGLPSYRLAILLAR